MTTPPNLSPLSQAIEVFVQGFTFTRSFTHPYLGERIGPLWVMRDAPRKSAKGYRREEWCVYRTAPGKADSTIRRQSRGHFAICALLDHGVSDQETRNQYKELGYRFGGTEALMAHTLKRIPRVPSPAIIKRVLTAKLADAVSQAAGFRQILPEHLTRDAPLRLYAAILDNNVAGWVRHIQCGEQCWVADMQVMPDYRRRKIASALLTHLMRDARKQGMQTAVLAASHAGSKLYTSLGYQMLGSLLLFTPRRKG